MLLNAGVNGTDSVDLRTNTCLAKRSDLERAVCGKDLVSRGQRASTKAVEANSVSVAPEVQSRLAVHSFPSHREEKDGLRAPTKPIEYPLRSVAKREKPILFSHAREGKL